MSDRNQFWPGRRNRLPHLLRKTIDPARWAAVSPRSPKTITHRGVLTAGFRMPPMATNRRTCRRRHPTPEIRHPISDILLSDSIGVTLLNALSALWYQGPGSLARPRRAILHSAPRRLWR